jgi:N-carbamoylputrescine amidase
MSSNRVDASGACGGVGWIISPDGEILARTSAAEPFATLEIDLDLAAAARRTYPRYVFPRSP